MICQRKKKSPQPIVNKEVIEISFFFDLESNSPMSGQYLAQDESHHSDDLHYIICTKVLRLGVTPHLNNKLRPLRERGSGGESVPPVFNNDDVCHHVCDDVCPHVCDDVCFRTCLLYKISLI